jgi:plastocyanin
MTRTTKTTARITLAGIAGLSALVLLLSGCAGNSSQMPPSGGTTTEPADPSDMPGMDMDMGDYDVEAISIKFMPETITVKAGTTVRWVNGEPSIITVGDTKAVTELRDINDSGTILGTHGDTAFVLARDGTLTWLAGVSSWVGNINSRGQVVGSAPPSGDFAAGMQALIWSPDCFDSCCAVSP